MTAIEMTKAPIIKLLLAEDNRGDARLLREMLNEPGSRIIELTHVECMRDAEKHLAEHATDVILLDPGLPDSQGLKTVQRVHAAAPHIPLVIMTGLDDDLLAAQALHEGAQDYLIKGEFGTRGLGRAIRYAIERNNMEEERKRLGRLKDEFVSTVSHELRTPLTSISGSIGLLIAKVAGDLPDPAPRLLGIAHTNCQRLVRLVDDILDIQKMESGQINFHFKRVEVRALVEQVIEANRGFAEGYRVQIRLADDSALGEVRADSDRLAQVVTNLLSNAIKFSPTDDEVVVTIVKSEESVRISVRNHGAGIPADFKPHVFKRFTQANATTTRQQGGSGLGLSIAKELVDRLGGKVSFTEAPGETTFHVDLPCWDHLASMTRDRDAPPVASRILLCEDDPDLAVVLREQLRQAGFATDFAYTAADAIKQAAATQYYAVLVDLLLPDGDGIDLIVRMRRLPEYNETPIIVVSVDPGLGLNDPRSPELNVFHWLRKPVDFDQLMIALTERITHDTAHS